ncbi:hypothetical protein CRG98_008143 [Punica granatum]|uniref:Uncharacterized protein n=1 Tax=Punica granatum TaxID=22663 RepID=A0A2I0KT03_PUNGR|nr:hypothetical protein CRG98_008143 [Punica granatum]
MDLYLDLPTCTCDAGLQLSAHKEKEKILSMDPNVNRAHAMAAHDEAQRPIAQGRDSNNEAIGFAAKIVNEAEGPNPNFGSSIGDFRSRGRPFCNYYRRNGHHEATCYQLHGYPSS